MNNKGFAITTLIYGLTIMGTLLIIIIMATLSSTRNSVKELASSIEKELLAYNDGNTSYRATTSKKFYTFTPAEGQEGFYRIELWGPQGSRGSNSCNGGKGAYTSGIIYLEKEQSIGIHVGNCGEASYILAQNSDSNNAYSNKVIMRAGAGGNSSELYGGTLCTTKTTKKYYSLSDIAGAAKTSVDNCHYNELSSNGTPTAGQPSYIIGYPAPNIPSSVSNGGKSYTFYDTIMVPDSNEGVGRATIEKLPTKTNNRSDSFNDNIINGNYWQGVSTIYVKLEGNRSKITNGQCKIYYKYDNTTHNFDIKASGDYVSTSGVNSTQPGYSSNMRLTDISLICSQKNGSAAVDYSGLIFNIILRGVHDKNGTTSGYYTGIYYGEYNPTDPSGVKLSASQPDAMIDKPKHGKYYIIPAYNPSYALTAPANDMESFGPVVLAPITGENRQKWIIDMIASGDNSYKLYQKIYSTTGVDEYRIVESARYKALDIKKDENIFGNIVSAQYQFNTLSKSDPQVWKLIPNKDGTYSIETIIPGSGSQTTGYITYGKPTEISIANAYRDLNENSIYIGKKESQPQANQKFKLYALDMSTSID